ncbi:hypothetical protein [Chlamydia gallinacea]|uniref:hypothetical protein n=1 Tax=Chlamydia gallinacea TaxID=1457153 RepID=UPI0024E23DD5|nr:hypothetical protein [Chlamydia gallinacea]
MALSPIHKRIDTATRPHSSKSTPIQKNKIFAWITLLLLTSLPLVAIGSILATPFIPQAIFIGLSSLAIFLVSIFALSIVVNYVSTSLSTPSPSLQPTTRPRDLDLSKLDTRHNRLLHHVIQRDEQQYQLQTKPKSRRKAARPYDPSSDTSPNTTPSAKKRSSVLQFLQHKLSSSSLSSDSDSSAKTIHAKNPEVRNQPWTSASSKRTPTD